MRLSKDGELVIMHDPTADRTTNGKGRVDEMTIAELTALRLNRSGENVPTLERFRELYPDARLGLICGEMSEKTIAEASRLGCMRIAPEWNKTGPLVVAKAHAAELSVNLWCSDSTFIYDTVKAWGADVSTSNIPRAIIAYARAAK